MTIDAKTHQGILLERANAILNSENYFTPTQRTEWENYLHAIQDVDTSGDIATFPQSPTEPVFPLNSTQLEERTRAITNREQVKTEYQNMIARLEQIQAAVNPTNAQIVQAVKDEALYIERIMKVIKSLVT